MGGNGVGWDEVVEESTTTCSVTLSIMMITRTRHFLRTQLKASCCLFSFLFDYSFLIKERTWGRRGRVHVC